MVEKPMVEGEDIVSRRDAAFFHCNCGVQPTGKCKTHLDDWREAIERAAAPAVSLTLPPTSLRPHEPSQLSFSLTDASITESKTREEVKGETEDSAIEDANDSSPCPVLPPLAECPRPSQFLRRGGGIHSSTAEASFRNP